MFAYLKDFVGLASKVKSLNFRGPVWGETPIGAPPIFVRFDLFLTSTYYEIWTYLGLKVQNFGGPD